MKSFSVTKNDENQRLDRFVLKNAPLLPNSLLYKYIRTKKIKVNRKRGEINTRLKCGDIVDMYINDEFFKPKKVVFDFLSSPPFLNIVYEDENIILIDKPQGLLVHPDKNEYRDTLIGRVQHYLYNKKEYDPEKENSFRPQLCNRIDRNTGGIVIAAKNSEALKIMCEKIKLREIDKFYITVVHGTPPKKQDTLTGYLEKNEQKNQVFLSGEKSSNNRTIVTKYRLIATKNNLSLLEVQLLTGRTHQIRAHLASIGNSLLGDGKYGKNSEDKKNGFVHQALYSYKIKFNFTTDAGILNYLNKKEFSVNNIWFAEKLFPKIKY